ncbi:DUF1642 domain-containing protein, partial [Enterococcus dispar]
KHFPKESQGYAANEARIIAYNIAINTLQQLDEPQAEKVEVPDFVAEWYEEHKYNLDNSIWAYVSSITQFHSRDLKLNDFEKWFSDFNNEPIETLISMMKDGYTVKPKRWVVRQGGSEVWYLQGFNSLDGDIVKQWCSHEGCIKFTDKAKAEAAATLVEGSVEQV